MFNFFRTRPTNAQQDVNSLKHTLASNIEVMFQYWDVKKRLLRNKIKSNYRSTLDNERKIRKEFIISYCHLKYVCLGNPSFH